MNSLLKTEMTPGSVKFYFNKGVLTEKKVDGKLSVADTSSLPAKVSGYLGMLIEVGYLIMAGFTGFDLESYAMLTVGGVMIFWSIVERFGWVRKKQNLFLIDRERVVFKMTKDEPFLVFKPPFRLMFKNITSVEFQLYEIVFTLKKGSERLDLNNIKDDLLMQIYSELKQMCDFHHIPFTVSNLAKNRELKEQAD